MPISLGTIGPVGFDDFNPPTWLQCMAELGCTTVQAYRNPQAGLSAAKIRELLAGPLRCDSLHAQYGPGFDPSEPDEQARRHAVENLKAEGLLVRELGGNLTVVHCCNCKSEGNPEPARAVRLGQLKKSVEELARFGRSIGIRYAFENLAPAHSVLHDVADLACLLKELNDPFAGMCFDVGHARLSGDPIKAARDAAATTIYVHLTDNFGVLDDHKMPGHGSIDCKAVIDELFRCGYDGIIMLEVFYPESQMRELIASGYRRKLADLLARPD